jgi:hypothetical protein
MLSHRLIDTLLHQTTQKYTVQRHQDLSQHDAFPIPSQFVPFTGYHNTLICNSLGYYPRSCGVAAPEQDAQPGFTHFAIVLHLPNSLQLQEPFTPSPFCGSFIGKHKVPQKRM